MELSTLEPLKEFIHSNNELGVIYRFPNSININLEIGLIMENYIHFQSKKTNDYHEVICIHKHAINKKLIR